MKIAFAGTPLFAQIQLQALLEAHQQVVVVYTQPDKPTGRGQTLQPSPVKTLALAANIPLEQPSSLTSVNAAQTLADYSVDVMIVAAYGLLLPPTILSIPHLGCINIHASLLPRWRGASPIQQAILAGDQQTGITLMQMAKGLDTGAILAQRSCAIEPSDTAQSLHDKLGSLGAQLLLDKLPTFPLPSTPQDENQATYASKITKADGQINWQKPASLIERQIRAYQPWPIAYSFIDNQLLRIWQAKIVPLKNTSPGTIVEHSAQGIVVATGEEGLLIHCAQLAGKKPLAFSEILKGHGQLFSINQRFLTSD